PPGCSFIGQAVIHAEGAPHHKQALSYFMRTADREFFWLAIKVQRPHFEFDWVFFIGAGEPSYLCRFTKCNYVRLGGCHRRSSQNDNATQYTRGSGHAGSYYQSAGQTQGQRSQSVVRTMSANTTAKSILETTADLGIAVLHRGGRAAIHGRVAQHERMSPFRAGPAGLKLGDLLNLRRGSKEPLHHFTQGKIAWPQTTISITEPPRDLWDRRRTWPQRATRTQAALAPPSRMPQTPS